MSQSHPSSATRWLPPSGATFHFRPPEVHRILPNPIQRDSEPPPHTSQSHPSSATRGPPRSRTFQPSPPQRHRLLPNPIQRDSEPPPHTSQSHPSSATRWLPPSGATFHFRPPEVHRILPNPIQRDSEPPPHTSQSHPSSATRGPPRSRTFQPSPPQRHRLLPNPIQRDSEPPPHTSQSHPSSPPWSSRRPLQESPPQLHRSRPLPLRRHPNPLTVTRDSAQDTDGYVVLFCGVELDEPENSSTAGDELLAPEALLQFPSILSSACDPPLCEGQKRYTGCGARIHTAAFTHRTTNCREWHAPPEGVTPDVIPLDRMYFLPESTTALQLQVQVCGCETGGVGCRICGNALGALLTPCAKHRSHSDRDSRYTFLSSAVSPPRQAAAASAEPIRAPSPRAGPVPPAAVSNPPTFGEAGNIFAHHYAGR
ncbi:hypothetical protein B0H11DRAFT_2295295 [Mycena galericulata]|nr:hypothetical protein B0H11DRAFT_2295295 [Mycena galericulata]